MTVKELRTLLACYPDDAPVLDAHGYDFRLMDIRPATVDIWLDDDTAEGYDTPLVGQAVSIGRKF